MKLPDNPKDEKLQENNTKKSFENYNTYILKALMHFLFFFSLTLFFLAVLAIIYINR